jgi:hypothetical protein
MVVDPHPVHHKSSAPTHPISSPNLCASFQRAAMPAKQNSHESHVVLHADVLHVDRDTDRGKT